MPFAANIRTLIGTKLSDPFSATGGFSTTVIGDYTYHTYTSSGTFIVTGSGVIDLLCVAGGGGGAGDYIRRHCLLIRGLNSILQYFLEHQAWRWQWVAFADIGNGNTNEAMNKH